MIPNQTLLRYPEVKDGYAKIVRGPTGEGYFLDALDGGFNFYMPLTQDEVAKEFKAAGKTWRYE